jgi:hypothetical protein
MNASDFAAIISLLRDGVIATWGVLDTITVVDDGTYRLSFLGFLVSTLFLIVIIKMINRIRNGASE